MKLIPSLLGSHMLKKMHLFQLVKFWQKVLLATCLIIFAQGSYAALKIERLVIFGDSLSDIGTNPNGGFNRYSNGRVWPEYLMANNHALAVDDYAYGGAKSDYTNLSGINWSGVL